METKDNDAEQTPTAPIIKTKKAWTKPETMLLSNGYNVNGGGPVTFAFEDGQNTPNNYKVERRSDHAVFSGINKTQNSLYAHS